MSHDDMKLFELVLGGVVLVLLIVVGLPVLLSFRQAAKNREFEHAERLKALELGRPWPGGDAAYVASPGNDVVQSGGPSRYMGIPIVVLIPLGALGIAALATSDSVRGNTTVDLVAWIAAGTVGVAGAICGTILTLRSSSAGIPAPSPHASTKPRLEEDAIDTVSRRG
jgi:hypothetical protein